MSGEIMGGPKAKKQQFFHVNLIDVATVLDFIKRFQLNFSHAIKLPKLGTDDL